MCVSSSYLQAEACIRDVVVKCLTDFARYMAGVGISGEWPDRPAGHVFAGWWAVASAEQALHLSGVLHVVYDVYLAAAICKPRSWPAYVTWWSRASWSLHAT
jgi:hypothetical protein